MRVKPTSRRRMGEQRRYFPDWTGWLPENRPELEADRNSYLAGGYAEEFGYRAQPGCSRGVWVLDEESPEQCPESHRQARAIHPGYPLRAHPIAPDELVEDWNVDLRRRPEYGDQSMQAQLDAGLHGTYVTVSSRLYQHKHRRLAQRVAVVATRFAAGVMLLRWSFARLRRPQY